METTKKAYFLGNEISKHGLHYGKVDYLSFSKSFEKVLINQCFNELQSRFSYDIENGDLLNDDGYPIEIYQFFAIDSNGVEIIKDFAPSEIVFYFNELDLYIWGVTHFGTAWDYVLTDIEISGNKGVFIEE